MISRIIEDEVGVMAEADNLTKTSIILDITKTESNDCLLYIERRKIKSCSCFFTDSKQHKARELDMITLRNHAPRSYMT